MTICGNNKIVLLTCNNCTGMAKKLLPEIRLRYSEYLSVLPVDCPASFEPFVIIKLLKNCSDGVIVVCPKDVCCCPKNKSVMKRREIFRDILPVFGLHSEQLKIASISPLGGNKLIGIIEQMLSFISINYKHPKECNLINFHPKYLQLLKWLS